MIDSYNYNGIDDNILFNGGKRKLLKSAKKKLTRVGNEIYSDFGKLSEKSKNKSHNIKESFKEDAKNIRDSFTSARSSDIVNANIALTDTLYNMSNDEKIKQFIIKNNGNIDNNLYKNLLSQIYQYKNKSLSFIKIIFYSKFNWVLKQYLLNVNNDKNIKSLINKLINEAELIKQINNLYNRKISKEDEVNILNNLQKILCIINILISAKFTVKKQKLTMSKNSEDIYQIISDKFNSNNNVIRLNINHISIFEDNIELISDILKEELPNIFTRNTYNIHNNKIHIFVNRFFNVKQDSKLKAITNELKTTLKPDDIKKFAKIVTIDNNIFNYKLDLNNNKIESFRETDINREQLEQPIKFIKFTMIGIDDNSDTDSILNNVLSKISEYFKALNIKNFNEDNLLPKNYQDNNELKHLVLNKILIFVTIILIVSHYDNYDDFYKNLLNYTSNQGQVGGGVTGIFDTLWQRMLNCFSQENSINEESHEEISEERESDDTEISQTKIKEIIKITANDDIKISLLDNITSRSNSLSSKTENLINEYLKIQFINIINNPGYLGILQTDDNGNDKEYKINMKDIQELYKDFDIGNDKNISQDTLLKNFTLGLDSNKLKKIDNIIDEKLTDNYLNFSIFKGIFDIPKEITHKTDKMIGGDSSEYPSELEAKPDEKQKQEEKQEEQEEQEETQQEKKQEEEEQEETQQEKKHEEEEQEETQEKKKQEEQQENINNIFADKNIIFIFNKLSEISNKSPKLNITDININTYNVDTFESIDSLFINIYNRLNYLNSKKIYFEINDNLYNITTTPVKFIEPLNLNDINIKPFSRPQPPNDITIPDIQIDNNLYNITTTPVKFIEPLNLNDINIKPFSRPQPPNDITIPDIQIDNNLYNITTTPVKFIEPLNLNDIKIKSFSRPQPPNDITISDIQIDNNLHNITTTPVKFIEPLNLNDIKIKPFSRPQPPNDITISDIQIYNNLHNITTTPVKFIEPLSVNGIKIEEFSIDSQKPIDIIIPNIEIDNNLYNITTSPVKFIEQLSVNGIEIEEFSIDSQKPMDIIIPNIEINDNLYNITTSLVKFIEPLSVNGIKVLPTLYELPQVDIQRAIEESKNAKREIESILENYENEVPPDKEEEIIEKLNKLRLAETDVIMKKCKGKHKGICKFIYDKLSPRYDQQRYIMENENNILAEDAYV